MTCKSSRWNLALAVAAFAALAALSAGSATAAGLKFHTLTLINNWGQYPGTRVPSVAVDPDGIVHMKGGLTRSTGNSKAPFVLPNAYRPSKTVYVLVDMLSASSGRLVIHPDGTVTVKSAVDSFHENFTSLEGVSYPLQ